MADLVCQAPVSGSFLAGMHAGKEWPEAVQETLSRLRRPCSGDDIISLCSLLPEVRKVMARRMLLGRCTWVC